jgi:hypothetical protein
LLRWLGKFSHPTFPSAHFPLTASIFIETFQGKNRFVIFFMDFLEDVKLVEGEGLMLFFRSILVISET